MLAAADCASDNTSAHNQPLPQDWKNSQALRIAINELEDHYSKAGTPFKMGLAERARPLFKKARLQPPKAEFR